MPKVAPILVADFDFWTEFHLFLKLGYIFVRRLLATKGDVQAQKVIV